MLNHYSLIQWDQLYSFVWLVEWLLQPYSLQPYSRQKCRLSFSGLPTEWLFSMKYYRPTKFLPTGEFHRFSLLKLRLNSIDFHLFSPLWAKRLVVFKFSDPLEEGCKLGPIVSRGQRLLFIIISIYLSLTVSLERRNELDAHENNVLLDQQHMTLEFVSFSNGKEAVAKAANVLFMKYSKYVVTNQNQKEKIFTESQMSEALKTVVSEGPELDLLLVYGPARCHLGFPAWRIKYTEIVHMGPLKSMNYGSLIKAIYKFTMVGQNYGK
ncbi:hypothetical protein J1N35_031327 [Gossypium stocksii]|uniref:ditrans,polycis-polyprenyl diphosphate synthase [(2E,6E)-farnesyldiphosphate specific] n=1 Tax=Gossypium stocksii TaxID=47602 RepID=A0A9D3ZV82_9ROSI|nr:hypothetical protein J1N35_031327 [Gossypium stocksii]